VITTILFHPTAPGIVFSGDAFSGVYRSIDSGQTWLAMSSGLRTRAVNSLAISADGWHIYAGTEGEGVFRLDFNGQPPADSESLFRDEPAVPSDQPEEREPDQDKPDEDKPEEATPDSDVEESGAATWSKTTILLATGGLLLLLAIGIMILASRER
jgi:hypothetical protein